MLGAEEEVFSLGLDLLSTFSLILLWNARGEGCCGVTLFGDGKSNFLNGSFESSKGFLRGLDATYLYGLDLGGSPGLGLGDILGDNDGDLLEDARGDISGLDGDIVPNGKEIEGSCCFGNKLFDEDDDDEEDDDL